MNTFVEHIWDSHTVANLGDSLSVIYVDQVLLHERTGATALRMLSDRGAPVRRPHACIATLDHIINTNPQVKGEAHAHYGNQFIKQLRDETQQHQITLFDLKHKERGISHILAIEQGLALPGTVVVCPDSHTSTVGALGALGLAVGSSECQSVLATQVLIRQRPSIFQIELNGQPSSYVTSKDIILYILGLLGPYGAKDCIIEFRGELLAHLSIDDRFTLCNMVPESGAESALIAPDQLTYNYIDKFHDKNKLNPYLPKFKAQFPLQYDKNLMCNLTELSPQITWGTHPSLVVAIDEPIPEFRASISRFLDQKEYLAMIEYMGVVPGKSLEHLSIQGAFIGSCGNASLGDLRQAAQILKGRQVSTGVRAICSPASEPIRYQAEQEGLARIFIESGFEWHYSGCAMCNSFNSPFLPGERVISSSNRNSEGRQGPGVRTHLASPSVVAASAIKGHIVNPQSIDL